MKRRKEEEIFEKDIEPENSKEDISEEDLFKDEDDLIFEDEDVF